MAVLDRLQQSLLCAGLALSAILLLKFAVDFTSYSSPGLAVPFWALVAATLVSGAVNVSKAVRGSKPAPIPNVARILLLAAIPIGFLGSSLDCMGLSLAGCSTLCTAIKLVVIPVIAILCAAYFFTGQAWLLLAVSTLSFAALFPHCVCRNPANAWWIDHLGESPACYVWGFAIGVISVAVLRTGAQVWLTTLICWAIIGGAFGFFVGHHYFHFPW